MVHKRRQAPTGARESNAGDDFHILWAARRVVGLLSPNTDLRRLVMEGILPEEADLFDDGEDYLLGVDLSEYHGGEDFETSSRVLVSQLKYSTRCPTRAWTAARLCNGKGMKSTLGRLAQVYQGFSRHYGRDGALAKLRVRMVSNQPIADGLKCAITAAQEYLHGEMGSVQTTRLLRKLPKPHADTIKTLQSNAGLKSSEFADFLRVLDLSAFGEGDRGLQRTRVIQELGASVRSELIPHVRAICDRLRTEAQPESQSSTGLTRADVLAELGVGLEEDLFPAPSQAERLSDPIETGDAQRLADLLARESRPIVAHGAAGTGKTTTVQQLSRWLPDTSVVVVLDCFGGGSYLDAGEQRHTRKRAILQISNELAVACGSPFLVQPPDELPDLQRDLWRRIETAAEVVRKQGGLLVVVVDAADNAMVAARTQGSDCFVPDLWQRRLPDNCRLLMTCRTHRRGQLQAPADVVEYRLTGFGTEASAIHLRRVFSDAGEKSCQQFHKRTGGNPRLQHYLLHRGGPEARTLDSVLASGPHDLQEVFSDLFDAAVRYAPDPSTAGLNVAKLICLTRPVMVTVLAESCHLNHDDMLTFCSALEPGLTLDGDQVSFRDEDFETYLRERVSDEDAQQAHDELGSLFLSRSDGDHYAARVVAEHLYLAGRLTDVVSLALAGSPPAVIRDEMLRLHVQRRRIELGLRSCCSGQARDADVVRLLVLAAEAARADSTIRAMIREAPGLSAVYGNPRSVARVFLQKGSEPWLGPAHFRVAATYARNPELREQAREEMNKALAWLRKRELLPESERYRWEIKDEDIACGAECIYWTEGAAAAAQWLGRWHPLGAVLNAARILARSLYAQIGDSKLNKDLQQVSVAPLMAGAFLASMWESGGSPARRLVERTYGGVMRARKAADKEAVEPWIVSFCELIAAHGMSAEEVDAIAKRFASGTPDYLPTEHTIVHGDYDAVLRMTCLRAALDGKVATVEDLLPAKYKDEEAKKKAASDGELHRFKEHMSKVLDAHQLRAQVIVGGGTARAVSQKVQNRLVSRDRVREQRWESTDHLYRSWAVRVCETLVMARGRSEKLIDKIAASVEGLLKAGAPWTWADMAGVLVRDVRYRRSAVRLLESGAQFVRERPFPAQERWRYLLQCASIAHPHDGSFARDLYRRALKAAEDVDDDCVHLLDFQLVQARKIKAELTETERRAIASQLAETVEKHQDFVSEPSELPWERTIATATFLDPPSGFALSSRWDDEDRISVGSNISAVVKEAADVRFVSGLEGLWLLRLAGEQYDISGDAIRLLAIVLEQGSSTRPQLADVAAAICEWIRCDLPPQQRKEAASRVLSWVDESRLGSMRGVAELRQMLQFAEAFAGEGDSSRTSPTAVRLERDAGRKALVRGVLRGAATAPMSALEEDVKTLWREAFDEEAVRKYFSNRIRATAPSERIALLDAIVSFEANSVFVGYTMDALKGCLEQWGSSPGVQEWMEEGVPRFLNRHLRSLLAYDHDSREQLREALNLPGVRSGNPLGLLVPAVAENLDGLGARALYDLADAISDALQASETRDILEWSLQRALARLPTIASSRTDPTPAELPQSAPEVLAGYFWSLFGHPDRRVRWRALHAARSIVYIPGSSVLRELIARSGGHSAGRFRSPRLEFYWMSALSWLMMLLLRVAKERPDLLVPHAMSIAQHALNQDFPHAQIRELARRACLELDSRSPGSLTPALRRDVEVCNTPRSCIWPRESTYGRGTLYSELRSRQGAGERYHFSSIDTIPYWFEPLARRFGVVTDEVTTRAEHWVCDRWGRADREWWDDERELRSERAWRYTRNDHGSIPRLEILQLYLEYHAMFCAAGQMIDEGLPVAVDTWDEPEEPWEEWIGRHLGGAGDALLSDMRWPTPMVREWWGQFPALDAWLRHDDLDEYESLLGMTETLHAGEIVVSGHVSVYDWQRNGEYYLNSALVTPATARSLVGALQSTDCRNYRLPDEGESTAFDRMEIDEPGFVLKGWIGGRQADARLEEFDPLAHGLSTGFDLAGRDFIATMGLREESAGSLKFVDHLGEKRAMTEVWSDDPQAERVHDSFSTGQRLWVRMDTLLSYLQSKRMDLVLETRIGRNRSHDHRGKDEKYDPGTSNFYILRQDGTLESLAGSRQVG